MKYSFHLLVMALILVFFSCDHEDKEEACLKDVDVSKIKVDVKIDRFDKALFACQSEEDVKKLLDSQSQLSNVFFQRKRFKNDELSGVLYGMVQDTALHHMADEVITSFGDMGPLKKELDEAFARNKYYYPEFVIPKIVTTITGYAKGADLFVSDDLIVIGIEHFMGPSYRYQPDEPHYIGRRYQKSAIVPFIVQAISARYLKTNPKEITTVSKMINYGKSYYFVQSMVPCYSDSSILGYTSKQMNNVLKHRAKIWSHYIDKGVLFETNHLRNKSYLEEGPFTLEISQEWCPGSIGRWTGLRIVKKYMKKNPEVTLQQLMANQNNKAIFEASKYKGQ